MKPTSEIEIREAIDTDTKGIRQVFEEVYQGDYPYHQFKNEEWLKYCI